MKIIRILLIILCVAILSSFVLVFCLNIMQNRIERKLRSLELGMTREQVKNIMGEPSRISNYALKGRKRESWVYPYFDPGGSGDNSCIFDSNTGILFKIYIDEDVIKNR